MEKTQARREIERRIKLLNPQQRALGSARIASALMELPEFTAAGTVMLYMSIADEVDTVPIVEQALAQGKKVALPKVDLKAKIMTAWRITDIKRDLAAGAFGIREPAFSDSVSPAEIDFCLVPARGFDTLGNRLGRGGGYYDRFMALPGFRAVRCGVAFDFQLLHGLPHEPHDLPVDIIVTESRVIRIS